MVGHLGGCVPDHHRAGVDGVAREHPQATRRLLVLMREQVRAVGVVVEPVYQWLLDGE